MSYLNFKKPSTYFILIIDLTLLILLSFELGVIFYLPASAWGHVEPYALIFVILIVLVLLTGGQWAYYSDHRDWNNGICKQNGLKWVLKDRDSQGGRLYEAGNKTIWISYPVERK